MSRVPTCSLLSVLATACGPLVPFDEIGGDEGSEASSAAGEDEAGTRTVDGGADDRPASDGGEVGADDAGDGADVGETGPAFVCGDGIVSGDEICDDGNDIPGDGCEPDCTTTPGQRLWEQTIDVAEDDDAARDVAVDASGSIYVVGSYSIAGNDDAWLRVLDSGGAIVGEGAVDLGGDELATSIAITASGPFVAGVQPDQDSGLLMRVNGVDLEVLDGAPTDIATFTSLVSETAEGFVVVTNSGGFDSLSADVRRFDPLALIMGDVGQPAGIYVGTAVASGNGGTIVGGGSFGGMGMGSSTWISALASDASTVWATQGAFERGISLRIRGLATAPDGSIVGVGTRGEGGGPMDQNDAGWVWWWSADGAAQSEGPLDIGGAAARPNAVVVGNHGLVVGGTLLTLDDGFVAGLAQDGTLQWGYDLVGDAGLEDRVSALAIDPGVGIVAVGTVTGYQTGDDAWVGMFTD